MKGYILDNYPKSYLDCQNLFCVELPPKIKEEEEIKEEKDIKENNNKGHNKKEKEEEKIEEIDYNREVIKESLPDYIIMIKNYNEESLKNKLQKNPEYNEKQQELDSRFNRRLEAYKKYNESNDVNFRNLEDFFKENNVKIFYVNEAEYMENKTKIEEDLIQNLEKDGFVDNYSKLFDEEDEVEFIRPIIEEKEKENEENILNINEEESKELADENKTNLNLEESQNKSRKIDVIKEDEGEESIVRIRQNEKRKTQRRLKEKEEHNKSRTKAKKSITKEKMQEKEENIEENTKKRKSGMKVEAKKVKISKNKTEEEQINDLKEREKILIEKKSEIIRRYISENIMPILAKGILFVSRNLPEDPVEALANFLMYNSFDIGKETDKNLVELEKMIQETEH